MSALISGCVEVSETSDDGSQISEEGKNNSDTDTDKNIDNELANLTSTGVREYNDQWLIDIDNRSLSSTDYTKTQVGETLTQSFILRSDNPIEETVQLSHLFFKQYFWTGQDSDITFSIIDAANQAVLIQQNYQTSPTDARSAIIKPGGTNALILDKPLDLKINHSYVMQFQVNKAEHNFSLYLSTKDYADGESNGQADIWFKALAGVHWLEYDALTITSDLNNQWVYDAGMATPLKAKMLSINNGSSHSEQLLVDKKVDNLALRYELSNPDLVNLKVSKGSSDAQDLLSFQGLQLGTSYLNIYHKLQLIDRIELQTTKPYTLDMSLSYIAYSGETMHDKMASFDRIKSDFEVVYKPLNIQLNWHDNGVIEFDWDLNGDGKSYTESRDEVMSPLTYNVLPDAEDYFTNLYLFRIDKNDETVRGCNGGGSSYSSEGNTAPRIGFKSVHFTQDLACIAPTLMHELAHNLGLGHYSAANADYLPVDNQLLNLMKTGRDENQVFAFQWKIMHQTLSDLAAQGKL